MDAQERRDFPPPDKKATLWRYLETYKFEDLLNTGTLYLSQVAKLAKGEPNEGRMNRLQEEALFRELKHDRNQLENFRAHHDRIRQRSWVTCFSLGEFDVAHMWTKFCKQQPNEGIAIKTTYGKLQMSLAKACVSRTQYPYCARVRYEQPDHLQWKHGYLLFQKVPEFSDECEVRACVLQLEEERPTEFLRIPVNLSQLIHRIYVHPKASDSYMRRVFDSVAKHLPKNQWRVRWSSLR